MRRSYLCVLVLFMSLAMSFAACNGSDDSFPQDAADSGEMDAGSDTSSDTSRDTESDATDTSSADVGDTDMPDASDVSDGGDTTDAGDTSTDTATDTGQDTADADDASDVTDTGPSTPTVEAVYPSNGAMWNDWVLNDGADAYSASDTACTISEVDNNPDHCLHAGQLRQVQLSFADCTNVTITDDLDAFDWECDDASGSAVARSTGLKDSASLTALIDVTANPPAWRENFVTATDGSTTEQTQPEVWWGNPVVVDNDGGSLTDADTIYVVTSGAAGANYFLNGDGSALIVDPAEQLTGAQDNGVLVEVQGARVWLEGTFEGSGQGDIIEGNGSDLLVMRNLTAKNTDGGQGLYLNRTDGALAYNVTVENCSSDGMWLTADQTRMRKMTFTNNGTSASSALDTDIYIRGDGNIFEDLTSTGDTISVGTGRTDVVDNVLRRTKVTGAQFKLDNSKGTRVIDLEMDGAGLQNAALISGGAGDSGAVFYKVRVENAADSGTHAMDVGQGITMLDVAVFNSAGSGVLMGTNGDGILIGATIYNTQDGTGLLVEAGNTAMSTLVLQSTDPDTPSNAYSLHVTQADSQFHNMALSKSGGEDVRLGTVADDTKMSGHLFVESAPAECFVSSGASNPPIDSNCVATASASGLTVSTGFGGQGVGAAPDFTLASSSPILGVAALPGGDDVLTHSIPTTSGQQFCTSIWDGGVYDSAQDTCSVTFLKDAYEIFDDGVGNDNGLCQSNETCVYMPNIGVYQGHGSLVQAGTIGAGGAIENVTLMEYDQNGM